MKTPSDDDINAFAGTRDAVRLLADALGRDYSPNVAAGALIWAAAECAIDQGMTIHDFVELVGRVLANLTQQDLVIGVGPAPDVPRKEAKPWPDA